MHSIEKHLYVPDSQAYFNSQRSQSNAMPFILAWVCRVGHSTPSTYTLAKADSELHASVVAY